MTINFSSEWKNDDFLRFFCALNEAWKVLWFISVILVKASGKWRRSCRKPHFKNDTWFMRRHLQIWLLKHHHNLVALRSSSGQFTLLLPSSQMLSSFLHHWLETWLCLILANEGTNEGRGTSRHSMHTGWKSQKKSHSILRAKRATFTFWIDKWQKVTKMSPYRRQNVAK